MEVVKKKIKLSIPVIDLFRNYSDAISKMKYLDQSIITQTSNEIKTIPHIIKTLLGMSKENLSGDDAFHIVQLSNQYDKLLNGIYSVFNTQLQSVVTSSSSSGMSDIFLNRVDTMFNELLVMYTSYGRTLINMNSDMLKRLGPLIYKIPQNDVVEIFEKYPGSELLYGQYITHQLETTNDKQYWEYQVIKLKNSMFDDVQQPPSKVQPLLQSMGIIITHVAKTPSELMAICFGVNDNAGTIQRFTTSAKRAQMGVLGIGMQAPGNYIYNISELVLSDNSKKYERVDSGCIDTDTITRYDTIKLIDSPVQKGGIDHICHGDGKYYVLFDIGNGLYSIGSVNGDMKIHNSLIKRLLRGPSIRINQLQKLSGESLHKYIHIPPEPEEEVLLDMNVFSNQMYDAVSEKFTQLINIKKPESYTALRALTYHVELFEVIRTYLVGNIKEIVDAPNDYVRTKLLISATSDMSNIIDNFKLSTSSEFEALQISYMVFKEKSGELLYSYLTAIVLPIFQKVITEILNGKTNIFKNVRNKNNQLNFQWK